MHEGGWDGLLFPSFQFIYEVVNGFQTDGILPECQFYQIETHRIPKIAAKAKIAYS